MKSQFCNPCNLSDAIPSLIAGELLGLEQLPLVEARYRVMRENYDCNYAQWQGRFGCGMRPFRGYTDTTAVPMPITHPVFCPDFTAIGKGAIGLDLPTWFHIGSSERIMLIAQDPLRSKRWYGECREAVVSSPFGLHDSEHRARGNGGRMVYKLACRLVAGGYGVYLTDACKFFVYDHSTSDTHAASRMNVYADILRREIAAVDPALCVCFGRQAERVVSAMGLGVEVLELPHLSGAARGAIVRKFPILKTVGATAENIARQYMLEIIESIKLN